jgi:hypothetical protein
MPVAHYLTGLAPTLRKAHPEDDVIQPRFEGDEQIVTGHTRYVVGIIEEAPELLLSQPVNPLYFLFLTEL